MSKKHILIPLGFAFAFAAGLTVPRAQTPGGKVGFVNVQEVLASSPSGKPINDLRNKANAELKTLEGKITPLQQKISSGKATAKERNDLSTLTQTYQSTAKKYEDQIKQKLTPVTNEINRAVGAAAKAQGFSVVMDRGVAASSGLVVYADEKGTDLTQAVIKQIKK
ncbi:outer membrane protein [Deinobacterium chartae]|uniref:Outer membrane protein n=1 Tax=Deinobacterium chartae TaxID=521158 RepID=A0A841HZJ9_9DEIO|nr:OmpH family outer membrane protein [Deinobacterium chartae]MBB6097312.1 outer membrane protein [Deinobacterium chartae]